MEENSVVYKIAEIPDPSYTQYQVAVGGNVLDAASKDAEHLSQMLANMPSGTSLEIIFSFNPLAEKKDPQSRLSIHLKGKAKDKASIEILQSLLERGPLNRLYDLKEASSQDCAPSEGFGAACSIVRRVESVAPLHSPEFNDKIPSSYYTIRPFEAVNASDYMILDRVLDGIKEPVYIQLHFQPADISRELSAHTAYLSKLQQINRPWDRDDDSDFELSGLLGNDANDWRSNRSQAIKPLRYTDPLADDILREQRRFHETLRRPHLIFQIVILAKTAGVAQLIGNVLANSAFGDGSYRLIPFSQDDSQFGDILKNIKNSQILVPVPQIAAQAPNPSSPHSGLERLAHVGTVAELKGVFRLPIASVSSPHCIRMNTDPQNDIGQKLLVIGRAQYGSKSLKGIRLLNTGKHTFMCGQSGFTKTNSARHIAIQLHKYGIPFMIIEPVKTEYRILKTLRNQDDKAARDLAEALQIYTPGDDTISPFRINPLEVPDGISIDEHIDNLLGLFNACIPVGGPLPALLGEALERVYEDFPDRKNTPIMADLVASAKRVLEEKSYSPEIKSDIAAALEVRLGTLTRRNTGRVFQCKHSYPTIEHLMKVPAIIELDRLTQDQANILALFILLSLRENLKTAPRAEDTVGYAIILEEAHNILGSNGSTVPSPEIADPKAFATDYFVRMLAELRSYGVALFVVDQFPTKIAPEVIKSTATKLAFCQVAEPDRRELADSMVLGPAEYEDLARLKPGEAFLYTEGWHRAQRITTPNLHDKYDFGALIYPHDILPHIRDDDWYKDMAIQRTMDELSLLRGKMDAFEDERLLIVQKFRNTLQTYEKILGERASDVKSRKLTDLKAQTRTLHKRLAHAHKLFVRNAYRRYLNRDAVHYFDDSSVTEMKDDLINRFERIIDPDVKKTLQLMKDFIDQTES